MSKIKDMIKANEGTGPIKNDRFMPYQDTVKKWTIGYGRNITDCGISLEEAEILLEGDINDVVLALDHSISWWRDKPENVQLVLQDLCFNMGISTLMTFKNTLLLINLGHYKDAADSLQKTKYHKDVPLRALRNEALLRDAEKEFGV